jgi:hypothetical protein
VNADVAIIACGEQKHGAARLQRSRFCIDCGTQLMALPIR